MAGFPAEKRNGFICLNCGATDNLPGIARNAARQINRNLLRLFCVDRRDQRQRRTLDRPGEPSPKLRIDDERRAPNRARLRHLDWTGPPRGRGGGVPLERCSVAKHPNPDLSAALREQTSRHKAVATVVARPSHHHDRPCRPPACHRIGNGASGILHQDSTRRPGRNREPVGARHFGGGQKLDHPQNLSKSAPNWR
jgi:hypothetical protein